MCAARPATALRFSTDVRNAKTVSDFFARLRIKAGIVGVSPSNKAGVYGITVADLIYWISPRKSSIKLSATRREVTMEKRECA